ncbi:hypothetical protein N802_07115 [Knoellia sinensis KCTC 19936]|uniref:Htaa domain-containing protein n=1 Tax=Knoellia sinensis KCTC 19936 TaxID=1385520 RepID=A0A0A0J2N9_9MICO|nr:hypothetical protein [Knoellia sinensis]KGN30407.1 hypothetical protein N802_07115 [Knoellia sinensis KCTC 19936]
MFPRLTRRVLPAALSVSALAATILISASAPASAAPGENNGNVVFRNHQTFKDSHIEQEEHGDEFCPDVPFDVRWDGNITVTDMVQTKGRGDFEYFSFKFSGSNTYTNLETGATFHDRVSFRSSDQKARFNEDGTLSLTIMDRLGWKLFDGNGKLVGVDAGLVKIDLVVDLSDPENPVDLSETVTEHGTRQLGERDFCTDVMTFIG